jgi:hypothetical protein
MQNCPMLSKTKIGSTSMQKTVAHSWEALKKTEQKENPTLSLSVKTELYKDDSFLPTL